MSAAGPVRPLWRRQRPGKTRQPGQVRPGLGTTAKSFGHFPQDHTPLGASRTVVQLDSMAAMDTIYPPKTPPRTPRVMVTLSPEARVLLDKMASLTGTPKSALVSELVDAGLPAIAGAVEALQLVKSGRNLEAERLINRFAHEATLQLSQQQLELHAEIDARTVKGKRLKRRASGRVTP